MLRVGEHASLAGAVDHELDIALITEGQVHLVRDPETGALPLQSAVAAGLFQTVQVDFIDAQKAVVFGEHDDHGRRLTGSRAAVAGPDKRAAAETGLGVVSGSIVAVHESDVDQLVAQDFLALPGSQVFVAEPDTVGPEIAVDLRVRESDETFLVPGPGRKLRCRRLLGSVRRFDMEGDYIATASTAKGSGIGAGPSILHGRGLVGRFAVRAVLERHLGQAVRIEHLGPDLHVLVGLRQDRIVGNRHDDRTCVRRLPAINGAGRAQIGRDRHPAGEFQRIAAEA